MFASAVIFAAQAVAHNIQIVTFEAICTSCTFIVVFDMFAVINGLDKV
jgi:hypothetical protein